MDLRIYLPNQAWWLEIAIRSSIGTDSHVLALDARNATRASFALSAGTAVPLSALSAVHEMILFWLGQMIPQTLNNIISPRPPPIPIEIVLLATSFVVWLPTVNVKQ